MPSGNNGDREKRPRALVTGGAVRLGKAIALALAAQGMDVAIGYHRSAREAARTRAAIERLGVRAVAIRSDLSRAAAARALVERAADALGGLDVLVNNAAIFSRTPFDDTTAASYDGFLALNVRAPFLCTQAAARVMTGGGHVVNVGDAAADRPMPAFVPYAVSKAAIAALTLHLAAALRSRRISVNAVAPGMVLRPRGLSRARWEALSRGRTVDVGDVTAAVAFFATCPVSVTGQVLRVE